MSRIADKLCTDDRLVQRGAFLLFADGDESYVPEWNYLSLEQREVYAERFRAVLKATPDSFTRKVVETA